MFFIRTVIRDQKDVAPEPVPSLLPSAFLKHTGQWPVDGKNKYHGISRENMGPLVKYQFGNNE
jgi:hypothetical protein